MLDYFISSFHFQFFSDYLVIYEQSHIDTNADITVSCAAIGDRFVMFSLLYFYMFLCLIKMYNFKFSFI
jgi:hypothetical protein